MNILRSISGIVLCTVTVLATSFCAVEAVGVLPATNCGSSSHQGNQPYPEQPDSVCCEFGAVKFLPTEEHTQNLVSVLIADLPAAVPSSLLLEFSNSGFRETQGPWPPIELVQPLQAFLRHTRSPRAPSSLA